MKFACDHMLILQPGFHSQHVSSQFGCIHAGKEADGLHHRVEFPSRLGSAIFIGGKVTTKYLASWLHSPNWRFESKVQPVLSRIPEVGEVVVEVSICSGNGLGQTNPIFSICVGRTEESRPCTLS